MGKSYELLLRSSELGRTFARPKSSLTSTTYARVFLRYHFRLRAPYVRVGISVFAEKPRTSKFIAAFMTYIAVTARNCCRRNSGPDRCIIKSNIKTAGIQCAMQFTRRYQCEIPRRLAFTAFCTRRLLSGAQYTRNTQASALLLNAWRRGPVEKV